MITTLIDKKDNFEIVRDLLASILAVESAEQMALATIAGEDPALWEFRTFIERTNPWEEFDESETPIVNVWFESCTEDSRASNLSQTIKTAGRYNIDVYGVAVSEDTVEGHAPGDRTAVYNAQRITRLVRNIIMSDHYAYLGEPVHTGSGRTIGARRVQSITAFQPQIDNAQAQRVAAHRLAIQVDFNETGPEYVGETLEYIGAQVTYGDNDEVFYNVDTDFTD